MFLSDIHDSWSIAYPSWKYLTPFRNSYRDDSRTNPFQGHYSW